MDWIKRLIRQFTEEDGSVPPTDSKKEMPPQQTRIHREVEARVSYQYPQGNFRFPLIPDEDGRQENESGRKRDRREQEKPVKNRRIRQKQEQQDNPAVYQEQPGTYRDIRRSKPVNKQAGQSAERADRPSESKRPFQRTEVPSPIYGFGKAPDGMYRSHFIDINKPYISPLDDVKKLKEMARETMMSDGYGDMARPPSISSFLNALSPIEQDAEREEETGYRNDDYEAEMENNWPVMEPEADEESVNENHERNTGREIMLESDQSQTRSEHDVHSEEIVYESYGEAQETVLEHHEPAVGAGHEVYREEAVSGMDDHAAEQGTGPGYNESFMEAAPVDSPEKPSPEKTMIHMDNEAESIPDGRNDSLKQEQTDGFNEAENADFQETPEITESDRASTDKTTPDAVNMQEEFAGRQQNTRDDKPVPKQHRERVDEKLNRPQGTRENETANVPYNVVMLKRDKDKAARKMPGKGSYQYPSLQLLDVPPKSPGDDEDWLKEQRELLDATLANFNVRAHVVGVTKGPAVTRFEVQPEPGVKVNKVTNLTDDIKLSLAAADIRIEAPIPGKNTIGIEVPNLKSAPVFLREILRSPAFMQSNSPLTVALGLDIAGQPVVTDLNKMPHGLIAGATGSGKSVCINSMLVSLLYKAAPHELKLLLIDPKMVELAPYNNLPHLVSPVITDVKAATAALKWSVEEMERRYELFAHAGVRDITRYNNKAREFGQKDQLLPYLVIVIDELADLMMVSPQDVEDAVCRIAQKARACGIHLVLATQRPSVDVITGLIKANIPTRAAFAVSSQVDSRTIIDGGGAEKLLGKGDMLFLENGSSKPVRIQGNFVSDDEIDRVADFVRAQQKPSYMFEPEDLVQRSQPDQLEDELFEEACLFAAQQGGASSSALQRRFRIGFNRAARLIDLMEAQGIVSEQKGSKPRDILVSKEKIEEIFTAESPLS
ncbi:DNA translocase FtsK [Bacillus marinisedimentorum]|uniref:DNA translocase FtsK n=1 Tax=Bacillus marinisedimentorum TaxID=1821260 RepID=UPI000872D868|nr:DNA translocase FtsK [Bacillus marinisedimentorum]